MEHAIPTVQSVGTLKQYYIEQVSLAGVRMEKMHYSSKIIFKTSFLPQAIEGLFH